MSVEWAGASTGVAGATSVETRALHRIALGIARDAAGVGLDDIAVELGDRRGDLRVTVVVPVVLARSDGTTLADRGEVLRETLVRRLGELASRRVGAVDVRFTGVRRALERRVA
ncbi:hypothetical protein ACFWCH_09475 [Microbacterium sp. NPDC060132]|uniref:hypothetical protein n=1 Tax=unclassified Microbacterium TaxID=2609290 RepID=UPI00365855FB